MWYELGYSTIKIERVNKNKESIHLKFPYKSNQRNSRNKCSHAVTDLKLQITIFRLYLANDIYKKILT